jgi:hypothetical protein
MVSQNKKETVMVIQNQSTTLEWINLRLSNNHTQKKSDVIKLKRNKKKKMKQLFKLATILYCKKQLVQKVANEYW